VYPFGQPQQCATVPYAVETAPDALVGTAPDALVGTVEPVPYAVETAPDALVGTVEPVPLVETVAPVLPIKQQSPNKRNITEELSTPQKRNCDRFEQFELLFINKIYNNRKSIQKMINETKGTDTFEQIRIHVSITEDIDTLSLSNYYESGEFRHKIINYAHRNINNMLFILFHRDKHIRNKFILILTKNRNY
jgi:hypothetical protein